MPSNETSLWNYNRQQNCRDFRSARAFVRQLHLTSHLAWEEYITGNRPELQEKPEDIPVEPDKTYNHIGWVSWDDWLGIEQTPQEKPPKDLWESNKDRQWMSFHEARDFAQSLNLEYQEDWEAYIKGLIQREEQLPDSIPPNPEQVYRHNGWKSWKDWLIPKERQIVYSSYNEARDFVVCLQLESKSGWFEYIKTDTGLHSNYNLDIPHRPHLEYAGKGWIDWATWLGTEIKILPYQELQKFISKLGLRSKQEWFEYCSGNHYKHQRKTNRIPCYPDIAYRNQGWIGWEVWLGLNQTNSISENVEDDLVECRCRGRIKDCAECDGKGYIKTKKL